MSRLEELNSSKMQELFLKKMSELEEICKKTRTVLEADSALECDTEAIDSGNIISCHCSTIDTFALLNVCIIPYFAGAVKENAFSKKDILEKVEKWLTACDEKYWLEEYNQVGD